MSLATINLAKLKMTRHGDTCWSICSVYIMSLCLGIWSPIKSPLVKTYYCSATTTLSWIQPSNMFSLSWPYYSLWLDCIRSRPDVCHYRQDRDRCLSSKIFWICQVLINGGRSTSGSRNKWCGQIAVSSDMVKLCPQVTSATSKHWGNKFILLGSWQRTSDIFDKRGVFYSDRLMLPMLDL